jgi:hypothetical protein
MASSNDKVEGFQNLSIWISPNFFKIPPLKIRGGRGVMEITPFIPLTLGGRFKGRSSLGI